MTKHRNAAEDVVKLVGVANKNADTEDVTRDTYGFSEPPPIRGSREQRVAQAEAAASGMPGVVIPHEKVNIRRRTGARSRKK
jgi:hypothetical protein